MKIAEQKSIPADIRKAPYHMMRIYMDAYNKAAKAGDLDPDKVARESIVQRYGVG